LPFGFLYSYSETDPSLRPIGFREPPRFSPFGPGRLDRAWDGVSAPAAGPPDPERIAVERAEVLGDPLTEPEVEELVERYRHSDCSRQINIGSLPSNHFALAFRFQLAFPRRKKFLLGKISKVEGKLTYEGFARFMNIVLGKGGVTHNLLDDIHNHWKKAEAVRIKCLGVPTLDMDNVCFHLEDKTGGKIIYRKVNILLLHRGRNYDPKRCPVVPLMLWKPRAPIYPRLVKNVADGLTFEETREMRDRGLNSPALMTLTRNGVYVNVVERVREAFKTEEVVRLDCSYVETSDCKKIGVKLRDLVPCVPILFKKGQIIIWRGKHQHTSADQCISDSLAPSLSSQVGEN
ncbi:hypothetical protein Taro_050716, partial [Colocasia esculenta]|nr:hypothetical protein [Colocasia esculenta]